MKSPLRHLPLIPQPTTLQPNLALRKVTSKSGKGVYASSDTLFKGAVFGRDSLEVADDLLLIKPRLVQHILLTLASLQGLHSHDISEEEHGKIVHEYRTAIVDGRRLDDMSKHIFHELSSRWGGNEHEMAYYGSIDATPKFIQVTGHYMHAHGHQLMNRAIRRRDGSIAPFRQSIVLATDWLVEKLSDSSSGLLEYRARNPHGIENQAWKDSREFYVHTNGKLANHKQPIGSIEVQGLAYDALEAAATLLPDRSAELKSHAQKLRDRTIELLWRPKIHYFALGIDHRDDGSIRPIETITANPATLLHSHFFDYLPEAAKRTYLSGLIRNIMGSDFLTDAGVRSRSLSESKLIKFWDYHGSFTSWPKETFDVAQGLRQQGFPQLADQLENRILNVVRKSRNYPEFVYVDSRGRVMAGPPDPRTHGELSLVVDSTNRPESIQAWTVSAVLAITTGRNPGKRRKKLHQKEWQIALEKEVLAHIPHVSPLRGNKELSARYPDYSYKLAQNKAKSSGNFLHETSDS
ncbi:MAG TPA: hypothetical protein VLF90_03295 [Patescibacteria group bacterium]|nr:hypothetical protein [Patescibacteria group bacterium]